MDWKKYLKIILYIIVFAGLIWVGYYLFTKTSAPPEQTKISSPTKITNEVSKAELSLITDEQILGYWADKTNGLTYFVNQSGQVIKISGSEKETASSQPLDKLNSIKLSPDGTKILAVFNYPDRPTISLFDDASSQWQPLSAYAISATWSPNSNKIAYLEDLGDSGSLKILDLTAKKTTEVSKVSVKDGQLQWVNQNEIFIMNQKPSASEQSSLWKINISNKTWQKVFENSYGLNVIWSNTENFGLAMNIADRKPYLNLIDQAGNNLSVLSFMTLPEKCAIDAKKIYCGVPRNIKAGIELPDDYYKRNVYFEDDLYLFDLSNGTTQVIFSNKETPIDAYNLSIKDERELLFINRYDDKLYSLPI